MAGSLPVGSGVPDILLASWQPAVLSLATISVPIVDILAYLRVVPRAKNGTIAARLRESERSTLRKMELLVTEQIVEVQKDWFSLSEEWRHVLSDVIAIEVKVSDWRGVLAQASRNSIFAHKSFVAMPERQAHKLVKLPMTRELGIGILSVARDGSVTLVKKARRRQPTVSSYYYQIASVLASEIGGKGALRPRLHHLA
jgi:hypothetical protein